MSKRIKVVHLVEDLNVGGLENVVAAIVSGLDPRRFEAEVWCLAKGGAVADRLRRSGTAVRVLDLATYHRPLNIARLAMRMRQWPADIVHTHGYVASTFGRLAAILAVIHPVVVHVHTSDLSLSRRHFWVERCLAHFAREIICVSRSVQSFVAGVEGVRTDKTRVIYNGATWRGRDNGSPLSRAGLGFAEADCVVVSVGSLVPNKGHRILIDAFRMLAPERPGLKLLIAGDGPLRRELEAYARTSQLSASIRFMGMVNDVRPLLALADIFALPSRQREGLPLAVLEAMQHRLPVVASHIGGIPEAVAHNRSGLLVPPNDARALRDALAKLADDAELRGAMGKEGKTIFDMQFKADRMISQIESLYGRILGEQDCDAA